jgi:hypothetical protein
LWQQFLSVQPFYLCQPIAGVLNGLMQFLLKELARQNLSSVRSYPNSSLFELHQFNSFPFLASAKNQADG